MKYSITNNTVTVLVDGELHTVHAEAETFERLKIALISGRFEEAADLIFPASKVIRWSQGNFEVEDGVVTYKGSRIPQRLNDRIFSLVKTNQDPTAFCNFWERLQNNPSMRSVQQLYDFMDHENIPITPDGFILAYKSVTSSFRDHHTKRIDNSVGVVNEMPRNQISDDPNSPCSFGFHVGSYQYASTFMGGEVILVCKVDPADVVCVPYDASSQKVRACKYEVLGVAVSPLQEGVVDPSNLNNFFITPPIPAPVEEEEDYEDEEDDDDNYDYAQNWY